MSKILKPFRFIAQKDRNSANTFFKLAKLILKQNKDCKRNNGPWNAYKRV